MRASMLIVAAALLVLVLSSTAGAQANSLSDRLLITDPNHNPIFDQILPETPGTVEPTLAFGGTPAPVSIPAGFPGAVVTLPGTKVVLFTETVADPGEPTLIYTNPLTGQQSIISDAIISTVGTVSSTGVPPYIMLLSDPNPDLTQVVTNLANAPTPPVLMPETGSLQDLTPIVGSTFPGLTFPIDVQAQSDVPEPTIGGLMAIGSLALVGLRRRQA
jgi:hypothetical protein